MIKSKGKIFTLAAAFALTAALAAGVFAPAAAEEAQFPVYTQEFTSEEAVNADFFAGYVNAVGNSTVTEQVGQDDGHWFLKDGILVRENSIDADAGTWRAAILTYSKQTFSNFELEVDYKQGNQTFWWTGVAFRQAEAGKSFFDDGAGIFVQEGGQPTMWGAIGVGGPFEKTTYPNYDRNAWHHLKLTVQGNKATLVVDSYPATEWNLNASFYQEGYVSLISINNDSAYDNFKITELPEPETPELPDIPPVEEADTDDALGNLSEKTDNTLIVERPVNYRRNEGGGCSSSIGAGFAAAGSAAAGLAALALVLKRK